MRCMLVALVVLVGCGESKKTPPPNPGSPADAAAAAAPVSPTCAADLARLRALVTDALDEGMPEIPMPPLVKIDRRAHRRTPQRQRLVNLTDSTAWAVGPDEALHGSDGWDVDGRIDQAALAQRITAVAAATPPPAGTPLAFRVYVQRGVPWSRVVAVFGALAAAQVERAEWMFDGDTTLREPGPPIADLPDLSTQLGDLYWTLEHATEATGATRGSDAWEPTFWKLLLEALAARGCPVAIPPLERWVWEFVAYRAGSGHPGLAIITAIPRPDDATAATVRAPAKTRWDEVVPRLLEAAGPADGTAAVRLAIGKP